jgi:hypothetical protein
MQCTAGACGPCADGATQCSGGIPQGCEGGIWVDRQPAACPYLCDPVAGCTGECVPGTSTCALGVKKTCGQDGRYTSETCDFVCVSGQCSGTCQPGTHRCNAAASQTCSTLGQWSGDVSCAYGCEGTTGECQACIPEAMTATCAGGGCGVKKNNCGADVDCGQCTGAGQTCGGGGTGGFCGCTPDPQSVTCDDGSRCAPTANNCGQQAICPDVCAAPETCGGGGMAGECGCTPIGAVAACAGKDCGTVGDGCGGHITCWPPGQTQCPNAGQGLTCGGGGLFLFQSELARLQTKCAAAQRHGAGRDNDDGFSFGAQLGGVGGDSGEAPLVRLAGFLIDQEG